MHIATFAEACDRLSQQVDAVQFERLRWSRCEGPMLARLVELAHAAVEQRGDMELVEEGSVGQTVGLVLKVHSQRIFRLDLAIEAGSALVAAATIARSPWRVDSGAPLSAKFETVDAGWMAGVLEDLFARLRTG